MNKNTDFADIHLIPRVISEIESRDDIKIEIKFNNNLTITAPFIASPMKDVCDSNIAIKMRELGGLGILHRFSSIEDNVTEYKKVTEANADCGCSIGVNGDHLDRFKALYDAGCRIVCVDTANGASTRVERTINSVAKYASDVDLIVGNVASKECYSWLEQFPNVRAIRVCIANGAACSTKNATGVYHGTASCISECAAAKKRTLLIADGGLKEPSDACKAIALGADMTMMGSLIAKTIDSPAELIKRDGKFYKIYHGSASFEIQKEYRDKPKYIEGVTRLLEYDNESLEALIDRFHDGLRSSMSYFNSKTLKEYRYHVSFSS